MSRRLTKHSPYHWIRRSVRIINAVCLPASLIFLFVGCGSLPSSGPSTSRTLADGSPKKRDRFYEIVPVDQAVVETLKKVEISGSDSGIASLQVPRPKPGSKVTRFADLAAHGNPPPQTIVKGDLVHVTIFSSGGLFAAPGIVGTEGSLQTIIPPQVVDETGDITVPFAGRIKANGRSPSQIEEDIRTALALKTIDPWVVVTVAERVGGDLLTITGDVQQPQRVSVPLSGLRLLDAVAAGGGSTGEPHETVVAVDRGGNVRAALLGEIYAKKNLNIPLQAGDTVIVTVSSWTFTTMGALGQRTTPFPKSEVSLSEAITAVGGLVDSQANPEGCFVFRFEPKAVAETLGLEPATVTEHGVPVVYAINLRRPQGIFISSQFQIRDKDHIFVGNAGTVGLMKALDLFNAITAPARSGLSTAAGFETLSN
jgi:polysaccharide export outer membrane protein